MARGDGDRRGAARARPSPPWPTRRGGRSWPAWPRARPRSTSWPSRSPDAARRLQAHQGAGAGGPGRAGPAGPVPAVRPRRRAAGRGLDLGRAVPTGVGGPLRPDGRVPRSTAIAPTRQTRHDERRQRRPRRGGDRAKLRRPGGAGLADVDRPRALPAWYGPDGATIPVAEMDVRVGGARRVCMEVGTPNGPMRMWFTGEHLEVVENGGSSTPSRCPTSTAARLGARRPSHHDRGARRARGRRRPHADGD